MRTHANRLVPGRARKIATGVLAPALGAALLVGSAVEAKTPGKSYCFYGKCHRVKTIAETTALIGKDETVSASHYDSCKRDRYNPCGLTSSGEQFHHDRPDNAASPIYPDGTTLLVWAPDTGASVVMRVNNAGPYWGNRKLDVSIKAAEVLGFKGQGVATLKVRVISAPTKEEATYKRNRSYPAVPGYIGQFASLDDAQTGAATAYMVAGLQSPFAPAGLGVGNPTQVAGVTGTQSGAAPVVPSALLASAKPVAQPAVTLAAAVAPAAPAAVAVPVKVAALVAKAPESKAVAHAAPGKTRADRVAQRNSRAYRVAARNQQRKKVVREQAVAAVSPQAPVKRYVTQDGTNDMSMFSRHTFAGIPRLAPQERTRQAALGPYATGNGG